jgi:hypothetical protein
VLWSPVPLQVWGLAAGSSGPPTSGAALDWTTEHEITKALALADRNNLKPVFRSPKAEGWQLALPRGPFLIESALKMSRQRATKVTVPNGVIERVTKHFLNSRDFNGLPVSSLMADMRLDWKQAKRVLSQLVEKNLITLNFAEINPFVRRFPDLDTEEQLKRLAALEEPKVVCAFPTLASLKNLSALDDRPFSKMLASGHAHLEPLFFDLAVLEMYSRDPRYHFHFRGYSGWIGIKDEFYCSDETECRDKIGVKQFGLGYDEQGRRVLTVFLTDLAKLSPEHQQYWKTKLLSVPCKMVGEFYDNTILGIWTTSISIYNALTQEQAEINKLSEMIGRPPLFLKTFEEAKPKEYCIYFRPTLGNFLNFVDVLDKMLSENINKEFFCEDVPLQERIRHSDGTVEVRALNTLTLLNNWLSLNIQFEKSDGLDLLMKPFREVRKLRNKSAHKIADDVYDPKYHEQQDTLVRDIYCSLHSLRGLLAQHPDACGYEPPKFLNDEHIKLF